MDGKYIICGGKKYFISNHARQRINTRDISIEEISDALTNFKTCRKTVKEGFKDGYRVLGRNKVVVVLNEDKTLIVTVLRANKDYHLAKTKARRNKTKVQRKRRYGNRARK